MRGPDNCGPDKCGPRKCRRSEERKAERARSRPALPRLGRRGEGAPRGRWAAPARSAQPGPLPAAADRRRRRRCRAPLQPRPYQTAGTGTACHGHASLFGSGVGSKGVVRIHPTSVSHTIRGFRAIFV
eukprot:362289-Chlamydomonas_euryale.AAC.5